MASAPPPGLTYEDLQRFPDDRLRRQLIDGELIVARPEHVDRAERRFVRSPDVVVEVSSPPTRRLELTRKRGLYERFWVEEYW